MSASLLLPAGLTVAHEAAVEGFDVDTQRRLLEVAAAEKLSVEGMLRYHRASQPKDETDESVDHHPPKAKSPRKTRARGGEKAAVSHHTVIGDSHQNKESPVKSPGISQPDVGKSHQKYDAAASSDAPASPAVTLTLTRLKVQQIADALREFARRKTGRGCHPRPNIQSEADRLAMVWKSFAERGDESVTLPLAEWQGYPVEPPLERRPGIVGLLTAAADGDERKWPSSLRIELCVLLRRVA